MSQANPAKKMNKNYLLGQRGETAAIKFLENKGYNIITRNFRAAGGEIDIVAEDGDTTVFVEVKSRSSHPSSRFGRASNAVDVKKKACLRSAIIEYQKLYPKSKKCRLEVAEVYFIDGIYQIKIIQV